MDIVSLLPGALSGGLHSLLAHFGVAFPFVAVLAAAYLLLNDVLDVALVFKHEGFTRLLPRDAVDALTSDVDNRQALALGLGVALTAVAAGGDLRAAILAGLVGVATANVANWEASTVAKVRELLKKRDVPPVGPGVPPVVAPEPNPPQGVS